MIVYVEDAYQAIFVTRDVDRDDLFQTEVPWEFWHNERCHEASASSIDVDGAVNFLLNQEIIDCLDILVLAGIRCANDGANTNGVLIDQVDGLFGVNHVAVLSAEDVTFLNFEVACGFFPADLDRRVHDDVGLGVVFAFCFTLVLPALLHGEGAKHLSNT